MKRLAVAAVLGTLAVALATDMIETAVRLISETGPDALSIAALARAMGINRTTVYYHFEHREALIGAVGCRRL